MFVFKRHLKLKNPINSKNIFMELSELSKNTNCYLFYRFFASFLNNIPVYCFFASVFDPRDKNIQNPKNHIHHTT